MHWVYTMCQALPVARNTVFPWILEWMYILNKTKHQITRSIMRRNKTERQYDWPEKAFSDHIWTFWMKWRDEIQNYLQKRYFKQKGPQKQTNSEQQWDLCGLSTMNEKQMGRNWILGESEARLNSHVVMVTARGWIVSVSTSPFTHLKKIYVEALTPVPQMLTYLEIRSFPV